MEWHESIIGKIGLIENTENKDINLEIAESMITNGMRIMKSWEIMKLLDEDSKSLRFLKIGYYFTYSNEIYYRASWLGRAGNGSRFYAVGWGVVVADGGLLGVLAVKED